MSELPPWLGCSRRIPSSTPQGAWDKLQWSSGIQGFRVGHRKSPDSHPEISNQLANTLPGPTMIPKSLRSQHHLIYQRIPDRFGLEGPLKLIPFHPFHEQGLSNLGLSKPGSVGAPCGSGMQKNTFQPGISRLCQDLPR